MYSLKVLKALQHPDDARIFEPGHDCHALDAFEVAELVHFFPEYFEAADEVTSAFLADQEKVKHLAESVKRKRDELEQAIAGKLKARKQ